MSSEQVEIWVNRTNPSASFQAEARARRGGVTDPAALIKLAIDGAAKGSNPMQAPAVQAMLSEKTSKWMGHSGSQGIAQAAEEGPATAAEQSKAKQKYADFAAAAKQSTGASEEAQEAGKA